MRPMKLKGLDFKKRKTNKEGIDLYNKSTKMVENVPAMNHNGSSVQSIGGSRVSYEGHQGECV